MGDIPALHKHRFPLMIDDAEPAVHLAVRAQAPNLVQLEVIKLIYEMRGKFKYIFLDF